MQLRLKMKFRLLKVFVIGVFLAISSLANAALIEIKDSGDASTDGWWEVSTMAGSYVSLESELTAQVWWDNVTLARLFNNTYKDGIDPSADIYSSAYDIYFAYKLVSGLDCSGVPCTFVNHQSPRIGQAGSNVTDGPRSYAVARKVSDVPEPSTLALFALGIMGLASRRFKKQA